MDTTRTALSAGLGLALLTLAVSCTSHKKSAHDDPPGGGEPGATSPLFEACDPDPDLAGAITLPWPYRGFDYAAALKTTCEGQGHPEAEKPLRDHGWALLEAIMAKPSKLRPRTQVWRTWPTAYPAFHPDSSGPLARTQAPGTPPAKTLIQINAENSDPDVVIQNRPLYPVPKDVCETYFPGQAACPGGPTREELFQIPGGRIFQNNGDVMLVSVVYDKRAYEHIEKFRMNSATYLDYYERMGLAEMPEFPNGSTVLKHMYWPVAGDGYTALPMWRDPIPDPGATYLGYETWKEAVAIRGNQVPRGATTANVEYLHGVTRWGPGPAPSPGMTRSFRAAPVVSVQDFYHWTPSRDELEAMCTYDRAILDQSSIWAFGRRFRFGDSLVTMATHINVKDASNSWEADPGLPPQAGWTMQTFWWNDQGVHHGKFGHQRPPSVPEGYFMSVSDGPYCMNQSSDQWPAKYNPYIELVIHPVKTNCQNCHSRAGWPNKANAKGSDPQPGVDYGAYQRSSGDPGLRTKLWSNSTINSKLMTVDYQWAVVDRAR